MDTNALFATALGLADPWYVAALDLDLKAKRLEIQLDFRRGGTFACAECGATGCKAHDTAERRWRHLDFFQFRTELVARTPRGSCERCGFTPSPYPGPGPAVASRSSSSPWCWRWRRTCRWPPSPDWSMSTTRASGD